MFKLNTILPILTWWEVMIRSYPVLLRVLSNYFDLVLFLSRSFSIISILRYSYPGISSSAGLIQAFPNYFDLALSLSNNFIYSYFDLILSLSKHFTVISILRSSFSGFFKLIRSCAVLFQTFSNHFDLVLSLSRPFSIILASHWPYPSSCFCYVFILPSFNCPPLVLFSSRWYQTLISLLHKKVN